MRGSLRTVVVIVAATLLIVGLSVLAVRHDDRVCQAKGGRIVFLYKAELCIAADGRILT